jgi:hypothetical protein
LRECLGIREEKLPDDWHTFDTQSQLGASLLGQKKYVEGEPLLLSGYQGLKDHESKIPFHRKNQLKDAGQKLVQLYEATGQSDQAAQWRQKLVELESVQTNKVPDSPNPAETKP